MYNLIVNQLQQNIHDFMAFAQIKHDINPTCLYKRDLIWLKLLWKQKQWQIFFQIVTYIWMLWIIKK